MNRRKILVIEDEAIIARDIQKSLEELGYEVPDTISSGEAAISMAGEVMPDLVLMDIVLQGDMDGIEAAEEIKNLYDIPVIYLTAYADDKVMERARVTEPFGYMIKPFEERELHTTIEMALYKHKVEKRLRESEQLFSTTLKSIGDAVITTDSEGVVTFLNPVAEGLTGFKMEEVKGRAIENVFRVNTGEDLFDEHLAGALGEEGARLVDRLLTGPGGRKIPVECSSSPIIDDKGEISGLALAFRDISERVKSEATRRNLESQLLQSQKMDAIGHLAGGIAHDFNNILTAIIGYVNILQMKMDDDDPLMTYVKQVMASSERASKLTQSLLTFSRKQVVSMSPVNINRVVNGVQKLLISMVGEGVRYSSELSDNDLVVMANEGQVEQIFINLVTNARDAMPEGGTIFIGTEAVRIDEAYAEEHLMLNPGAYACIAVTDTGTGMDRKTREMIFEPFFTTKEVGKGTGLGLSIVFGIVKQYNGGINVYSEPGSGTTIKVYLPLIKEDTAEKGETSDLSVERGDETILVAEDDASIRAMIRESLQNAGYRVVEAADGAEAVTRYHSVKEAIDMLLLDVVMPIKTGQSVYEELKEVDPDIKVLFMSGYAGDILLNKGIDEKEASFISKPFTPLSLLKKIRETLYR